MRIEFIGNESNFHIPHTLHNMEGRADTAPTKNGTIASPTKTQNLLFPSTYQAKMFYPPIYKFFWNFPGLALLKSKGKVVGVEGAMSKDSMFFTNVL